MELDKYIDARGLKSKALEKYNNKQEVTLKWIKLCKQLNPGMKATHYITLVIELISLMDYILENLLKEDYNPSKIHLILWTTSKYCRIKETFFLKAP